MGEDSVSGQDKYIAELINRVNYYNSTELNKDTARPEYNFFTKSLREIKQDVDLSIEVRRELIEKYERILERVIEDFGPFFPSEEDKSLMRKIRYIEIKSNSGKKA